MSFHSGLDIGGTKIAGAIYNSEGKELKRLIRTTPASYRELIHTCDAIVQELEQSADSASTLGIGLPGAVDQKAGSVPFAVNTPCIAGQPLRKDLEAALNRRIHLANDADCFALSEATDGAGKDGNLVLGIIMGTGVGAGLVANKIIITGPNGLTGEFGHTPLPFREPSDGPLFECACGKKDCIEKSTNGSGLSRLYQFMMGEYKGAEEISIQARVGNKDALRVLDQFYTVVTKAMANVIYMFDPDVIVVGGGLYDLPGLYDGVSKRLTKYVSCEKLQTQFVPAKFGSMSGLRGAAWVGKNS